MAKTAADMRCEVRHLVENGLSMYRRGARGTTVCAELTSADAALSGTLEKPIKMNYASYTTAIVEQHGVQLVGWPLETFANPGVLPVPELKQLYKALLTKQCCWEHVPAAHTEDGAETGSNDGSGGAPKRKRKIRKDAGIPRGPRKDRDGTRTKKNAKPGDGKSQAEGSDGVDQDSR